jgi:hypothetical protein
VRDLFLGEAGFFMTIPFQGGDSPENPSLHWIQKTVYRHWDKRLDKRPERPEGGESDVSEICHMQLTAPRDYDEIWYVLQSPAIGVTADNAPIADASARAEIALFFGAQPDDRFLFLDGLSADDKTLFARSGLRPDILNRSLEQSISQHARWNNHSRRFQIDAVRTRAIFTLDPFTGALLRSATSFPVSRDVVFYRFVGREVFYLAATQVGVGYKRNALFFPQHRLVVKLTDDVWTLRQDNLTRLRMSLVANAPAVARYIAGDATRSRVAVIQGHPNYAHTLWNELTGLLRLERAGLLGTVDRFFVFRGPFGPLRAIFPSIRADAVRYYAADGDPVESVSAAMFVDVLEGDYFVVNVGDDFIREELVARVRHAAMQAVPEAKRETIESFRAAHDLVVMVTIRTERRTWVAQAAGLTQILRSLAAQYPRLGIVIDGFSLPQDFFTECFEHPWIALGEREEKVLAAEGAVVEEIKSGLAQTDSDVISISGCSMYEATLWMNAIDFAVTHSGSNQHKAGWLGNKPTVVHGNRRVLMPMQSGHSYYYRVREFGVPPLFLCPEDVRDIQLLGAIEGDLRNDLDDYDVDVDALSELVIGVAHRLTARKSSVAVLRDHIRRLQSYAVRSGKTRDFTNAFKGSPLGAGARAARALLGKRKSRGA